VHACMHACVRASMGTCTCMHVCPKKQCNHVVVSKREPQTLFVITNNTLISLSQQNCDKI